MKVYVGNRAKTKQTFTIPLLSPAMAVLKKYQNKLPVISNVKYNEYLKVIAQAAGIDKPVSSHWARHTGATLLLNEGGMDLKTVAKICACSFECRGFEPVWAPQQTKSCNPRDYGGFTFPKCGILMEHF